MATLFNTRISDTYVGLIKTTDNAAISATLKELTDGSGNSTGLFVNNAGDFKVNSVLEFGSLKDTGENITITKFVDSADGIPNNNNDTSIPTSKAVKDFVETHVTAQDLDFRGDDAAVDGDVDLDSEKFIILGTANEIETTVTSAGGNTLQIGIVTNPALSGNVGIAGNIDFADNAKARFGAGQDLQIRHDGTDSFITNDTGQFYIQNTSDNKIIELQSDNGSGGVAAYFRANGNTGSAILYHYGSEKFTTLVAGAKVTGNLEVTGTITGSGGSFLPLAGGTMTGNTIHNDNVKSIYGTSADGLWIYHDGSNSYINDQGTGSLKILATDFDLANSAANASMMRAIDGGQVELYYSGAKKLETTSSGVTIIGRLSGLTDPTQAQDAVTKSYVDNLDAASDLDFSGDTGTGDVTLNTQTFSVIGTANQIETTASNQQLQLNLPSSINVNSASATALQTARDISLTGQATATISSFDGSSNVSGAVTLDNDSVTGKVLTGLASPTASNILASDSILQAFGKAQSQINTLAGGLRFMGTWNANTNSPTLASGGGEADSGTTTGTATNKLIQSGQNFTSTVTNGDQVVNQASGATALVTNVDSNTQLTLDADIMVSGQAYTIDNSPFITQGHYYVVSVGGTQSLNGVSNWAVGDWVIAGAGNTWEKLDHTQVDGTGTAGKIAKFSSTNVIADSLLTESGSTLSFTGELGISNASPQQKLDTPNIVIGGTSISASYRANSTMMDNLGGVARFYSLGADNATAGSYQFNCLSANASAGAGTVMTITPTGNVGIGVAVPDSRLDVTGGDITVNTAGTGFMNFKYGSAGSENVMGTITTDGVNLKVNAASQLQLRPGGNILATRSSGNNGFISIIENGNTGNAAYSALRLKNDDAGFAEIWRNSSTKAGTGDAALSLNVYNSAEVNIWSGANRAVNFDVSQNATFDGDVNVQDNLYLQDGAVTRAKIQLNSSDRDNLDIKAVSLGSLMRFYTVDTLALTLDDSQNATFAGNVIIHNTSNAPYIDFVESGATTDSKARITMDQVDTNNGTLLFATENAGTLYNQIKLTQTGNLLLSDDAANFNTSDAKINIVPTTSNVYQQWSYSPSNDNFSLKLKQTVTSGNVRYVFEQINNSTTYDNTLVLNQGKIGIGEVDPSFLIDLKKGYSSGDGKVAKFRAGNDATFVQFDTVQVVQQDVPCLAIIETSTGTQSDEQKLTLNVGDTRAVIGSSSTVTDGISFRVNRAVDAHGYAQTGTKILHLKNDGNAVFHQDITARIGNFKSPDATDSTLMNLMANNGNNAVTFRTTASGSVFKIQSQNSGEVEIESKILSLHHPTDNLAQFRVLRVEASSTYAYMSTVGGTAQFGGTGDTRVRADGSNKLKLATNGSDRLTILSSGDIQLAGNTLISSNTADGSDNAQLIIAGGGADGDSRGASVHIAGNESGNGGLLQLRAGSGSVSEIRSYTGALERMRIADTLITFPTVTELRGDIGSNKFAIGNMGDASSQMMVSSRGFLTFNVSNTGSAKDATERMRINNSGDVLINTTLTNVYTNTTANQGGVSIMKTPSGSRLDVARDGSCYTANRPSTTGIIHDFRQAGAQVGTITITNSSTAYNTSSDYRLKEDLQDFAGLDMVSKIPVYDFKWKTDESRSYGVMAHELQEVLPQAVVGEKDAEEMQSVDYSKIVPLLVKSIQELKAEVDKLKQECKCK